LVIGMPGIVRRVAYLPVLAEYVGACVSETAWGAQ